MADQSDRGAFVWYELMTPDVEASNAFYREVIGWEIDPQPVPSGGGGDYHMIRRADGSFAGGLLVMGDEMVSEGWQPGWFGYIHSSHVDTAAGKVGASGGSVKMGPMDVPGVGRIAFATDPQGAAFYLMRPTQPPGDPAAKSDAFSPDRPQHVRWNELQTTDPSAAVEFYAELFGWRQEGSMPMGELGDYLFIQRAGEMIGAIMPKMPDAPGSGWSYYFGVEDIDRAADAVTTGGGSLNGEIQQIPGGEYAVHCSDPQGAAFGLVGPRKES